MAIFTRRFSGILTVASLFIVFVILSACTPATNLAGTAEPATASALLPVTATAVAATEVLSTAEITETNPVTVATDTPDVALTRSRPAVTAVIDASATSPPETPQLSGEPGITISGIVQSGEDTTPANLLDAPRVFVYEVQQEDGTSAQVTYTAYPPSPVGDKHVITLNFYAGSIQIGDYLIARGIYDSETSTLTVIGEGDYIETYPEKP